MTWVTPFGYPSKRPNPSSQCGVDLVQHRGPRAKILCLEAIEWALVSIQVGVEVFGVGGQVEKSGEDFALLGGAGDVGLGVDLVAGVVGRVELAELDHGAFDAG